MARPQANTSKGSGVALLLSLAYLGLVAYASLYPFVQWHWQGVMPWAFLRSPLPRYWSGFDITINVVGYIPFGVLMAIAWLRHEHPPMRRKLGILCLVTLTASAVSFVMEALQTYIALRVPSTVDWALNTLGGFGGALLALTLERVGMLRHWWRFRERHFASGSGFVLGLLVLWPIALLYPTPVPLALGLSLGPWLELGEQILPLKIEAALITLGLLIPVLMGYAVTPNWLWRLILGSLLMLAAISVTTLTNGLSFGAEHASVWLHEQSTRGLWAGGLLGLLLIVAPSGLCWVLAFLLLVPQLILLSIMSVDPYFVQMLQLWGVGPFIRFYGATQWLGYVWPYAALMLIISKLVRSVHLAHCSMPRASGKNAA